MILTIKLAIKNLLLLCFTFYSTNAFSEFPKTESDFSLLPPYCKAKLAPSGNSQDISMWSKIIGRPFGHIHHYCAGLHTVNIANKTDESTPKRHHLQVAIGEFEYVINNSDREPIISEIYTQQGKVLLRLDRISEALNAFQQAIQINKDYAPAYMAMADLYISQGNNQEALDIVNRGLKYAPKSKGLKRRLDTLN